MVIAPLGFVNGFVFREVPVLTRRVLVIGSSCRVFVVFILSVLDTGAFNLVFGTSFT